jgi:hypothetical protein
VNDRAALPAIGIARPGGRDSHRANYPVQKKRQSRIPTTQAVGIDIRYIISKDDDELASGVLNLRFFDEEKTLFTRSHAPAWERNSPTLLRRSSANQH